MVYVNDFEIFRPQLIRAGQQEGLSFANIDLIRDITFSSGGYEVRYGNKMSSVLDIHLQETRGNKKQCFCQSFGGFCPFGRKQETRAQCISQIQIPDRSKVQDQ